MHITLQGAQVLFFIEKQFNVLLNFVLHQAALEANTYHLLRSVFLGLYMTMIY